MACLKCKGERIIWMKDKYGRAVANSCPSCNRNGDPIKKELKEWGLEREKRSY